MSYTRVNWKNKSQSPTTPLSAENLNIMDSGIANLDRDVTDILENKLAPATRTKVGLVKPDGRTTTVLSDGTIVAIGGGGGGASVASEVIFDDGIAKLDADNVQDAIDNFKSSYDEQKDKGFLESSNLFDKNSAEIGKYIDPNGEIKTYNDAYLSDFIKVKPNTSYFFSGIVGNDFRLFAYQENGTLISRLAVVTGNVNEAFTTPSNCAYLRYSATKNSIDTSQVTEGTVATPYQPFARSNAELTEDIASVQSALNGLIKVVQFSFTPTTTGRQIIDVRSRITDTPKAVIPICLAPDANADAHLGPMVMQYNSYIRVTPSVANIAYTIRLICIY